MCNETKQPFRYRGVTILIGSSCRVVKEWKVRSVEELHRVAALLPVKHLETPDPPSQGRRKETEPSIGICTAHLYSSNEAKSREAGDSTEMVKGLATPHIARDAIFTVVLSFLKLSCSRLSRVKEDHGGLWVKFSFMA